jgi:hypothetical protein
MATWKSEREMEKKKIGIGKACYEDGRWTDLVKDWAHLQALELIVLNLQVVMPESYIVIIVISYTASVNLITTEWEYGCRNITTI